MKSYFIDFNDEFDDATYRGHMGQLAIWACDRTLNLAKWPAATVSKPPAARSRRRQALHSRVTRISKWPKTEIRL